MHLDVNVWLRGKADGADVANVLSRPHLIADGDETGLGLDVHILHQSGVVGFDGDRVPLAKVLAVNPCVPVLLQNLHDFTVGNGQEGCALGTGKINGVKTLREEVG